MKIKIKTLFISFSSVFLLYGCSFTPYHDNFSCNKGAGEGECDSVSNIYLHSQKSKEIVEEQKNQTEKVEDINEYKDIKMQKKIEDILYYQQLRNEYLSQKLVEQQEIK